ncbi:MAG: circularly permuted type 2 ATP-grasp protein [Desulfovibrionaceae bacterium]|nr:circularly permuted type 2 ATP-grasp protein [Desulfovibrionaceae bacterium]
MYSLVEARDTVNKWMERYGVRFGIYKNGLFKEQLFPFDAIPRVISAKDWEYLEKGLIQRVTALNLFLADIYGEKAIVKSGVVPEHFVFSSKGYMPQCEGLKPSKGIYAHIAGIDLVQAEDDTWYILEDNLRIPSGASYPMIARTITRKAKPDTFSANHIYDNRYYSDLLSDMMSYVNVGDGLAVILTPGRYNSAFFEHSYLAERTGAVLAFPGDLVVDGDTVYYQGLFHEKQRVGVIYRRVSDEYLDPLVFESSSLLGIPNLMRACAAGTVALVNFVGNGVADDKGIYYFVPKMVKYYLGEEPILKNAPTYLPYYEEDRKYVLANIERLVIKDVSEAGGYGVVFGRDLDREKLAELKALVENEPRRWIAQEVINFKDLETMEGKNCVMRKADLRAFVISGRTTEVWKSGLTRFAREADSFVVNSSQGGGFKDTWVLKD